VVLTDKPSQRVIIEDNIALNSREGRGDEGREAECACACAFQPLEWDAPRDVDALCREHLSAPPALAPPLELVMAADVLYGSKVAASFVSVLTRLLVAYRALAGAGAGTLAVDPVVLVAQKVRSDTSVSLAAAAPGFDVELVREEAGVRVWRLRYKH